MRIAVKSPAIHVDFNKFMGTHVVPIKLLVTLLLLPSPVNTSINTTISNVITVFLMMLIPVEIMNPTVIHNINRNNMTISYDVIFNRD